MWVLFTSTYSGPQGFFAKDNKMDLPPDILDKISKDFWEKTCAPWDEKMDPRVARLAELRANVTRLTNLLSAAEGQHEILQAEADEFDKQIAKDDAVCTPAEQSREGRVAECEYDILQGRYKIAANKVTLKQIEGEDIAEELETAESELKVLTDEIAAEKAKAKEESDARSKAKAEAEQKANTDSDAEAERIAAAEKKAQQDYAKALTKGGEPIGSLVQGSVDQTSEEVKFVKDPETTIAQLRTFAAKNNIGIGPAKLKTDIVNAILAAIVIQEKKPDGQPTTNEEQGQTGHGSRVTSDGEGNRQNA